jgi:RNA polymerase sigma-70 factor (ECF subfamily)
MPRAGFFGLNFLAGTMNPGRESLNDGKSTKIPELLAKLASYRHHGAAESSLGSLGDVMKESADPFWSEPESDCSTGDMTSITKLIRKARDGSESARAKVLRQLQPFVISMAATHNDVWFRNKHGVSDIVQQSFVKVIENFDSFRGSSSAEFRGWLKTLVINEIRQMNRDLTRQRRDVKRERSLEAATSGNRDNVVMEDPTPASNAILNEQLGLLKRVVDDLDELPKQVVKLRAFEKLSFREIAKRLNRTQEAVTKIWYRTLIRLQKQLADMEDSE